MKNQTTFLISLLLICFVAFGCQFKFGDEAQSKTEKPGNEKTEKPEKKETVEKTEKKTPKSEESSDEVENITETKSNALSGSERPNGESKAVSDALGTNKNATSGGNWLYVYDARKGYGFYVPGGTTGGWSKVRNVDTFVGATPNNVGIYVFAWKDRKATRETLLNNAGEILAGMGETVKTGNLIGSSNNYAVVEATSVDKQGVNSKMRILVGTDVTDNYVMIVGCDEKDFDKKKDTVDAIWGSFEMWSGRK